MCPDRPEGPHGVGGNPTILIWGGVGGLGTRNPDTLKLYLLLVTASPGSDRQLSHPSHHHPRTLGSATYSSLTATPFTMLERKKSSPQKERHERDPAAPTVTCHGTGTGTGSDTRDPAGDIGDRQLPRVFRRLRLKIGPLVLLLTFPSFLPSHGEYVYVCGWVGVSIWTRWEFSWLLRLSDSPSVCVCVCGLC